ncbi:restriction endonuclease subunit S [Mesorhizobium sp.]|uniref:restriction endonuclease subunit S n=1 Tax=Mesorhizobium sp. TaxID=1871066 RepID=UPI000FE7A05B|nr:restriction endonuclease subunit S [Mesorhizobium sp.]RWP41740.1 MAG: restriction endonuclease subunit S [Mesorhizobium sp.]
MSARNVAIGQLTTSASTWNPARNPEELLRYIDLSAVDQGTKSIANASVIKGKDAPSRARQLVKSGDILVSTVRPNLNGVAPITEEYEGATASTGFCVLRPDPYRLASSYLMHWVRSPQFIESMVREATGASYPAVSDRIIKSSLIPLPPLPEQRRIAAILDKADALRRKRKRAIELLDNLTQSIFLEMFGEPTTNSKGFPLANLEDVVTAVVDCPHTTPNWAPSGKVALRTSNLTVGGWDWSDKRFVSEQEFHERSLRAYVKPGDIVLSREGTVGVAAIVRDDMQVCLGQRLVQIRLNGAPISREYLLSFLLYELAPKRISRIMVGATSTHLNLKDLRKMIVRFRQKYFRKITNIKPEKLNY